MDNMAKTQEELNVIKEEVETLNKKLAELTDEELKNIAGGVELEDDEMETSIDGDEALEKSIRKSSYDTIIQELRRREHYEKPSVKRTIRPGRIREKKCK